MVTNPIALGIAVFFAIVTLSPKRPGFGESVTDYLAVMAGALIAAAFCAISFATH